jgi:hypothetical protein
MNTVVLEKTHTPVRVELRRNASDFLDGSRFYYAYFFTAAGCFGSARVTDSVFLPIEVPSMTQKARDNFALAAKALEKEIFRLAAFLNANGEDRGDLESEVALQWNIKKRGRKALEDEPMIRTSILLTAEDKEKLQLLGGAAWIRAQIRAARVGEL